MSERRSFLKKQRWYNTANVLLFIVEGGWVSDLNNNMDGPVFVLPNVKWKEKWIQFNHMENEWLGFPLCMLEKYTFLYHPRYEKRNDGIKWEAQWSFLKIKKMYHIHPTAAV